MQVTYPKSVISRDLSSKVTNKIANNLPKALNPFIRIFERRKIYKFSNRDLGHQPIFIIGAPRTGSTILYQVLTNTFDVLYIDNLVDKWHRNFFFGFWRSVKKFGNSPHNNFTSSQGNTVNGGLHSPSECGEFWYRWLPKSKHFIDHDEVNPETRNEIYSNIASVINYFNKPLVFKNLNAGQRMRLIKQVFPEAKFIWIKRDILFTAQSILQAKRDLGIPDDSYWSIMPKEVEDLKKMPWPEQIVKQIYFIEKQIQQDSKLFKDVLVVNYDEIVNDLDGVIATIGRFFSLPERSDQMKPSIKGGNKMSIPSMEFELLKYQVEMLNHDK